METPVATTVLLVLAGALWHWRFARASRMRHAEALSRDCFAAGFVMLAVGLALFGRRVGTPTSAETLATVVLDAGGIELMVLGTIGWATSSDTRTELLNLTGETLMFVDADGELLFTLLPQFGRAAATLPPPLPGLYLIVNPALVRTDEAARRTDLRVVDTSSAKRASDGERLLVRRLRVPDKVFVADSQVSPSR